MSIHPDPIYFLRDPAYLPLFEAEAREIGLDYEMRVTIDEDSYNTIVAPVEGLRSTIAAFLVVVLCLGVAVLILMSLFSVRERKFEIGVLRAMGMKKGKVACGFICETCTLAVVCLALGLAAGAAASQPAADSLLQRQVEIEQAATLALSGPQPRATQAQITGARFSRNRQGPMALPVAQPLSEISVSLSPQAILLIAAAAALLALAASTAGLVGVMRHQPMRILVERG